MRNEVPVIRLRDYVMSTFFRRSVRSARCIRAAVTAALLVFSACAESEPVASVAITTDRVEMPRGRHFSVSFRFNAFPEIASLDGDHQVLVRFLDDDQEVIWQDDHFPPLPTTEWQPGQVIEYSRRVAPPLYPYIGNLIVAVGLYSPSTATNPPLLGEELGFGLYKGTVVTLAPRQESNLLFYDDGWYDEEHDPTTDRRWRWTSEQSTLTFRNPESNAMLYLQVASPPPGAVATPQILQVRVAEEVLHEVNIESNGSQFLELPLSASQLGEDEIVSLDLLVEPSFIPAALGGGSTDERRLGARVLYIFVDRE